MPFEPFQSGRTLASPDQPVRTGQVFEVSDYLTEDNKPALSIQLPVRHMANFYKADERLVDGYWPSSHRGSQYISGSVKDIAHAMQITRDFVLPTEIRQSANRAADRLSEVFNNIAHRTIEHDRVEGRIDRRKLPTIAKESARGTFDVDRVRPYYRSTPNPTKKPTIAVVGSAANQQLHDDHSYLPKLLTLSLAIAWGCTTAGFDAYSSLNEDYYGIASKKYARAIEAHMLITPQTQTPTRCYAVCCHTALWFNGWMTAAASDYNTLSKMLDLGGYPTRADRLGYGFKSKDAGQSVHWAREVLKADIIISMGSGIRDDSKADIRVNHRDTVPQIIESIIGQAKKLWQ